ncbi:carph-isopro domain-containing protein [Bradyrhizobium sp. SZCCHNRI1073]|uniref:carph-isopro domain-containing protein n=1 Tax=Bradyrhizobium sp. SZCCHNRI1073 TaxID=3057280 RepID=UPI0039677DB6
MALTADEIIELLGGTSTVAEALGQATSTVSGWKSRPGGIPAPHWAALVKLAAAQGCKKVTLEALAELAAARRPFAEARA